MKAIIIGATGLVGSLILKEVLNDGIFDEVRIFVRKSTGINNPKLKEIISPMTDPDSLAGEIKGDVLFNAIGTTIRKAGSKAEQQRIDRDIPVTFARLASFNGVERMVNVSSIGASITGNYYLRTKAEMEEGTAKYFPGRIWHFRPGFLVGTRKESRPAEKASGVIMGIFDPLLGGSMKKYKMMPADKLARAMVNLAKDPSGKSEVLYYPEIMKLL